MPKDEPDSQSDGRDADDECEQVRGLDRRHDGAARPTDPRSGVEDSHPTMGAERRRSVPCSCCFGHDEQVAFWMHACCIDLRHPPVENVVRRRERAGALAVVVAPYVGDWVYAVAV